MTTLQPLNSLKFFCRNGVHRADECQCPAERGYPSLREWWADEQHRRYTLYWATVAAICLAVFVYGSFQR